MTIRLSKQIRFILTDSVDLLVKMQGFTMAWQKLKISHYNKMVFNNESA